MEQTNIDKFVEIYRKLYGAKSDFNILHSIHLSENDHSNILIDLLNSSQEIMNSFLEEVIRVENVDKYRDLVAIGQCQAIPPSAQYGKNKNTGYIDILIKGQGGKNNEGIVIVIENKVCGATDGLFQLQRYYCTVVKDEGKRTKFANEGPFGISEEIQPISDNVYVVYLTAIGGEAPIMGNKKGKSTGSISDSLKNELGGKYKCINYQNDIKKWLKERAKSDSNSKLSSQIKLYLEYLEDSVELLKPALAELLSKDQDFVKDLEINDGSEDWKFHSAAMGYIKFWKGGWMGENGRKIARFHFSIDNCCDKNPMITLHVEHKDCTKTKDDLITLFQKDTDPKIQNLAEKWTKTMNIWACDLSKVIDKEIRLDNFLNKTKIEDFIRKEKIKQIINIVDELMNPK